MTDHSPPHEQLLQRVICEELEPTSPVVLQLMEECEVCRQSLEGMQEVERGLFHAAGGFREAGASRAPRDQAFVRETLQALVRTGERLPANARPLRWLAAAVILLIAYFAYDVVRSGAPLPPTYLGPEALRCVAPVGRVDSFEEFRWTSEEEGGTFELEIEGDPAFYREVRFLTGEEWRPTEVELSAFPDSIVWRVRRLDENGIPGPAAQAMATRNGS